MDSVSLFAQSSYYDYSYTPSSTEESVAAAGAMVFIMVFALVLTAIAYVINSFLLARIFKKAGVETWKAWVPIYNNWITLELGGQKGYWAALALIPFVNIVAAVFMIIAMYHIGLKFGKDGAFVLLAIFLPLVWLAWLAFDDSKWSGPKLETAPAAPSPDTEQPANTVENK